MSFRKIITFQIENTSAKDLNFIYWLFEVAISYIKNNNYTGWATYDKKLYSTGDEYATSV